MAECRVCKSKADVPMLKNELWALVSPPEEVKEFSIAQGYAVRRGSIPDFLCINCVERRLGRTIYSEDLNNSLWSECIRNIVKRELDRAKEGG